MRIVNKDNKDELIKEKALATARNSGNTITTDTYGKVIIAKKVRLGTTPKTLKDTSTKFKCYEEFKRGANIFKDMDLLFEKKHTKTEKEYDDKESK